MRDGGRDALLQAALEKARGLLSAGDLYGASAAAREALEIDYESEDARAVLHQADKAVAEHREARERATRLEDDGRPAEAVDAWKRALEVMPGDEAAQQAVARIEGILDQVGRLRERARAALDSRDLAAARSALADALEVLPGDPETIEDLATVRSEEKRSAEGLEAALELLAQARYDEGCEALEKLAEEFPGEARIAAAVKHARRISDAVEHFLREGRALLDARRPEVACLYALVVQKLSPHSGTSNILLEEAREERRALLEALATVRQHTEKSEFQEVLSVLEAFGGLASPHEEVAQQALRAYEGLRQAQRAARDETRGRVSEAVHRARELLGAGNADGALSACQEALRVDRRSEEARDLLAEIEAALEHREAAEADPERDTGFYDIEQIKDRG
ncbi:MAG: hypothetical protein ACYS99_04620 [Planctomycetota bacterium]